jgi:hypothetical protein
MIWKEEIHLVGMSRMMTQQMKFGHKVWSMGKKYITLILLQALAEKILDIHDCIKFLLLFIF